MLALLALAPPLEPPAEPRAGVVTVGVLAAGAICVVLAARWRRSLFARDALRARVDAASGVPPFFWLLLAIAGWWAWAIAGSALLSGFPDARSPDRPALGAIIATLAYAAGVLVMAALALLWLADLRRAGLRCTARDAGPATLASVLGFPVILSIGILSFMAATAVARLTGGTPPDPIAHESLRTILEPVEGVSRAVRIGALALQAVVLAPIFEELVYRMCLQSSLVAAMRRTSLPIAISSAVFAFVHLGSVPPHALPVLFAVGALSGIVFERTGRIGPAILVHALFNGLNLTLAMLTATGD